MSKPFDYSKWDKIELSDDEEDVHPNIDRESWFRMKHRSRVEREEHEEKDKQRIKAEVSTGRCSSRKLCLFLNDQVDQVYIQIDMLLHSLNLSLCVFVYCPSYL